MVFDRFSAKIGPQRPRLEKRYINQHKLAREIDSKAPGFRPEPKIVHIWGPNGPDRLPNPTKKVEGVAIHAFGRVWRPIGPVKTPNINVFAAPVCILVTDGRNLG